MDKLFSDSLSKIEELYTSGKLEEARETSVHFSNSNRELLSTKAGKEYLDGLINLSSKWIEKEETKEAFGIRGNSYADLKQYERAIKDYDKAIELDPSYVHAYNGRGNSYFDLKQYESAIKDYDKATELDPNYVFAYYNRGNSYADLKQYERAIKDYDKAIELDPSYVHAYNNRGNSYDELKQSERKIEDYNKAIELDPNYFLAYYNRGRTNSKLKQHERAIEDYDKAIELNPQYSDAYYGRGNIYLKLNDYERAIIEYDKAIELNPDYANIYYVRGKSYASLNEFKLAISSFKKYIQLSKDIFWKEKAESKITELEDRLQDNKYDKVIEIIDIIKEGLIFGQGDITHYTGISTAKALIIDKNAFRLSEATFLNDTSEGEKLNKYLDIKEKIVQGKGELASELYAKKTFIGSFVSPDQCDDLTLWRMYGKESNEEAKGCSLTINSEAFIAGIKANLDTDQKNGASGLDKEFTFYRVAYIEKNNTILIPGAEEQTKELSNNLVSLKKKLKAYKDGLPIKVREKLSEISYLFKQAHYQYEREVRLVISGVGFEKEVDSTFEIPRVYIELGSVISAIPRMTIGPKVDRAEEWAAAFYYCFEKKDADCEISISRLPFK